MAHQLSGPWGTWLYRQPLGRLWLRPWFDGLCLASISHWLFPLLRGLAAAQAAQGDEFLFREGTGIAKPLNGPLTHFLGDQKDRLARHNVASAEWERAAFQGDSVQDLLAKERARHRAAMALSKGAWPLVPHLRQLPNMRFEVPDPDRLRERLQPRYPDPDTWVYPLPEMERIQTSPRVPSHFGRESWVRFPSPVQGDDVTARVYEPNQLTGDEPTFIFLHGIGMEPEFWPQQPDAVNALTARGFRVVRPEGPWHGRRRLPGWFGGEPIMGRAPLGMLELFRAWIGEVSILVRWARSQSSGPVVLGGVSLGALTSQRYAVAAGDWPSDCRPDHLFLVATSENFLDIAFTGGLGRKLGVAAQLRQAGWTPESLAHWLPLLEPRGRPAVPSDRVIMVLGDRDIVTPFPGGLSLAQRWRVPKENLFIHRQGHFTLCLGLLNHTKPLRRLLEQTGQQGSRSLK